MTMANGEKLDGSAQNEGHQQNQKRRKKKHSPESQLRHDLDKCSKHKDLHQAIQLYNNAVAQGINLSQHHYNALLYICSSQAMEPCQEDSKTLAVNKGFELYHHMMSSNVAANEATLTAVARLAAANEDGDMAFEMVKKMVSQHLSPKLRSYNPALLSFCKRKDADKAYEVDDYMAARGVKLEEDELRALLKVSADVARGDKIYSLLHRLRATVRQVSETSCGVIEEWFKSKVGCEVGEEKWDVGKIKKGVVKGGGGWHGQGWLGKGEWRVERTVMSEEGVCQCCGEQLVSIDIDSNETDNFAESLARLACQREAQQSFKHFQEWLDSHGPYDYIVDGANIGLFQQNFADGGFSSSQLNAIVEELRERSPVKKWPLVILHNKRAKGGLSEHLFESWRKAGALYTTPTGSNDDWYWLYAAVRFKCFLVTNDQMRDHLFELLGRDFFPKWREKHQVCFNFNKFGSELHMPPPYSVVIQESETGSWHIPVKGDDDIGTVKSWLCVTRAGTSGIQKQIGSLMQETKTTCQSLFPVSEGSCGACMLAVAIDNQGVRI